MKYLSYEEARKFVHTLNLETIKDWKVWKKLSKPASIPGSPNEYYKYKTNEWKGWGDFLGHNKNMLCYEDAKSYMHNSVIKRYSDWMVFSASSDFPKFLPKNPSYVYSNVWRGWQDFLGNKFLSYEEAKNKISGLNIRSAREFVKYKNRPKDVPHNPAKYYKSNGWKGWKNFLGKIDFIDFDKIKFNNSFYEIGEYRLDAVNGKMYNHSNEEISYMNSYGYKCIKIYGKNYSLHRLIFMLHNKLTEIPCGYEIDHIDSDKLNNKIDNLQMLSVSQHRAKTGIQLLIKNKENIDDVLLWDEKNKKFLKCKIDFL